MQGWFFILTPIFLPLSSLWAAATVENESGSSNMRLNAFGSGYGSNGMNDSKSRGKSIFSEKSITISESTESPQMVREPQLFEVEYGKAK
jgi:hypothetical protein